MKKKSFKTKTGFTIIETMISISLFLIIVMAGMSALLNANLLHQKSRDMRAILDSLSFAMEDMSRNIRTGYNYYCVFSGEIPPEGIPNPRTRSCADINNPGAGISFQSSPPTSQWNYYLSANQSDPTGRTYSLFKKANGTVDQLTPDEIKITSASFLITGAESPPGDNLQPFVTIKLKGTITFKNVDSPFSLQTSVSQRLLDN